MPQKSLSDNKELSYLQDFIHQELHNGKSRQDIFLKLKDNYRDTKTLAEIVANTPTESQIKANIPWRNVMICAIVVFGVMGIVQNLFLIEQPSQLKKIISCVFIILICSFDIWLYLYESKRKLWRLPFTIILISFFRSHQWGDILWLIAVLIAAVLVYLHSKAVKKMRNAKVKFGEHGYEIVEETN
jgi:fucose 4-O-acetylase-like acetyltransferase